MLINAGVYKGGVRVDLSTADVYAYQPDIAKDEFLWLAFKDPVEAELSAIGSQLNIPHLVVEDMLHGNQQPKMEEYGNGQIFVILRQYGWDDNNELQEGEVALFVSPTSAISVRRGFGGDFIKVRQRAHEEKELLAKGTGFVLYAILDIVVDRYFPVIVEFEKRIDALEEKMFSMGDDVLDRKKMAQDLHAIRRELGRFKQGVEPLLEATTKLFGGRVPKICVHLGDYFRDVHDHLSRILSSCERMRDDATSATQTNLALVTIEESEITKKLASYAAIFAVITLMAGVWGMNFEQMPELKWKYGYIFAIACMSVVSGLLWKKFKKAGWL